MLKPVPVTALQETVPGAPGPCPGRRGQGFAPSTGARGRRPRRDGYGSGFVFPEGGRPVATRAAATAQPRWQPLDPPLGARRFYNLTRGRGRREGAGPTRGGRGGPSQRAPAPTCGVRRKSVLREPRGGAGGSVRSGRMERCKTELKGGR